LSVLAKDVDGFVRKLSAETTNSDGSVELEFPDTHLSVFKAFSYAELSQLRSHRDVCVSLLKFLNREYAFKLLTIDKAEVQNFWHSVLHDAKPLDDA
jgi:hypothetical protein